MTKKDVNTVEIEDTMDAMSTLSEIWFDTLDIAAFDHPDDAVKAASGERNERFNLGVFFQRGGMTNQAAYNLNKAKEMWDEAEARRDEADLNHGNDYPRTERAGDYCAKADAHWRNALWDFTFEVDRFNLAMGGFETWGGSKAIAEDNGVAWYAATVAEKLDRRVLTPKTRDLKAEKAAMLKAARSA
mgnify:CR=1 FL=1